MFWDLFTAGLSGRIRRELRLRLALRKLHGAYIYLSVELRYATCSEDEIDLDCARSMIFDHICYLRADLACDYGCTVGGVDGELGVAR
jgi:hypothetical protein